MIEKGKVEAAVTFFMDDCLHGREIMSQCFDGRSAAEIATQFPTMQSVQSAYIESSERLAWTNLGFAARNAHFMADVHWKTTASTQPQPTELPTSQFDGPNRSPYAGRTSVNSQ